MKVIFLTHAQEDWNFWEKNNPKILERIEKLITDIQAHPFSGIGKPEPLQFKRKGFWSRRINREHRLVYYIEENHLYILQCRYHY